MTSASVVLLCCALAASAAGPPRKVFPSAYDQYDFANGLRLITIPTDYPNVVALYIVVGTGSRNEVEPGKSGFAHLFEHVMFRGTESYPPDKYEGVLKAAGAASNAYTSDDLTTYHTTFSKEDFESILRMEADRFRNLKYSQDVFKTETLAVLGEYNKNSASPTAKLYEVLRDAAFDQHTYKHTTMGFLKDIQNMPNMYDYSLQFFDRYYRPEYTTVIVSGDVETAKIRALVGKYWGDWKAGSHRAAVPKEPSQQGPRSNEVKWPTATLPWITVSFKGPAYSDTEIDQAALDLVSFVGFSESSELYQKLVIREQKVDMLQADNADHVDPNLFTVWARVKKAEDVGYVQDQILATLAQFRQTAVPGQRLDAVKSHLRYRFALSMDNSESIAATVARYVALRRTPETINLVYQLYDRITPEDVQRIAGRYFVESGRTIVTLRPGEAQ